VKPSSVAQIALAMLALGGGSESWARPAELARDDLLWLNRVTYGADSATVAAYTRLGRSRFLESQLDPKHASLPPGVAEQIAGLGISDERANAPVVRLAAINAENQRINGLANDDEKQAARKALNDEGNTLAYEAARRHVLRAVYSPAQLEEQLVWFWLNHFNVFQVKGTSAG